MIFIINLFFNLKDYIRNERSEEHYTVVQRKAKSYFGKYKEQN